MCGKAIKRLKRKNSLKDGGEVAGRMQHANYLYVLAGSSVEDEIVLRGCPEISLGTTVDLLDS